MDVSSNVEIYFQFFSSRKMKRTINFPLNSVICPIKFGLILIHIITDGTKAIHVDKQIILRKGGGKRWMWIKTKPEGQRTQAIESKT